jgi:hypothetical protein
MYRREGVHGREELREKLGVGEGKEGVGRGAGERVVAGK